MKEGDCPQRISVVTEIWKGRYKGEKVTLKVLRVGRGETDVQRMKSVSASCHPWEGVDRHLTNMIAVL